MEKQQGSRGAGEQGSKIRLPFLFIAFCFFLPPTSYLLPPAQAQSVTIETGLGYIEQGNNQYLDYFKFGARAMIPVSESASLYVAPYWMGGFNVDTGVWFRLPITIEDLEGFRSYIGPGLSLTQARFGFALSAAISYDLSDQTALMLTYTHRPLLSPSFSQAFDIALGVSFELQ